jgi:hypothetical protein
MANIEIDLQDTDGMIVSVAQADPAVWAGIAAQCTALAAQNGLSILTGQLFNPPERTIDSFGAFQNWMATQSNVGAVRAPATSGTGSSTGSKALIVGLVGVGLLALAALVAASRPKS